MWLIVGLHLDGWAHHRFQLETFFTPWHAVLYSGFGFSAAAVGFAFLNGLRAGRSWQAALPAAYQTALLGTIIFIFGGLADMTWHTLLGVEEGFEALVSPPHLVLAIGGGLLVSAPLRTGKGQNQNDLISKRTIAGLPAQFSATALAGLVAFFTSFAHLVEMLEPFGQGLSIRLNTSPLNAATAVILQSALLSGITLILVRRFRLLPESFTLLVSLLTLLAASQHENWSLAAYGLAGGLVSDFLYAFLHIQERWSGWRIRLFAALIPGAYYLLIFAGLKLSGGLYWSIELWLGTVVLSAITGWLVSYTVFPSVSKET